MKTILAVGELPSLADIYAASMIAMYAGSDFIKTFTGKEDINANLPVSIVMCRAIRDFNRQTNRMERRNKVIHGGSQWLILVKKELGNQWLNKYLFRIGASCLLDDIVRAIN